MFGVLYSQKNPLEDGQIVQNIARRERKIRVIFVWTKRAKRQMGQNAAATASVLVIIAPKITVFLRLISMTRSMQNVMEYVNLCTR
jgi:hypothetical protein